MNNFIDIEILTEFEKVSDVLLFGSYARQEQTPDSDIDIMILVEQNRKEGDRSCLSSYLTSMNHFLDPEQSKCRVKILNKETFIKFIDSFHENPKDCVPNTIIQNHCVIWKKKDENDILTIDILKDLVEKIKNKKLNTLIKKKEKVKDIPPEPEKEKNEDGEIPSNKSGEQQEGDVQ